MIEDLFPARVDVSNRDAQSPKMFDRAPSATQFMPSETKLSFILYTIRDNILFAQEFAEGLTFREVSKLAPAFLRGDAGARRIILRGEPPLAGRASRTSPAFALALCPRRGEFLPARIRQRGESDVWETVQVHLAPLMVIAAEIAALDDTP